MVSVENENQQQQQQQQQQTQNLLTLNEYDVYQNQNKSDK